MAFGTSPAATERMIARMRAIASRRHLKQLQMLADIYEVAALIHAGRNESARLRAEEIGMRELAAAMREEMPSID